MHSFVCQNTVRSSPSRISLIEQLQCIKWPLGVSAWQQEGNVGEKISRSRLRSMRRKTKLLNYQSVVISDIQTLCGAGWWVRWQSYFILNVWLRLLKADSSYCLHLHYTKNKLNLYAVLSLTKKVACLDFCVRETKNACVSLSFFYLAHITVDNNGWTLIFCHVSRIKKEMRVFCPRLTQKSEIFNPFLYFGENAR